MPPTKDYIFQEGIFLLMIRLTARVSGRVQMVGYRARVVDLARSLGLVGFVQNLPDGRVEVVAEGEKSDLGRFASALKMENSLIRVDDVETAYSEATGSFPGFRKVIDPEELGDRLDEGVGILKEILVTVKEGFGDLGEKMDTMLEKQDAMLEKQDAMLEKQDAMLEKQDAMLEKQDSTLGEIQGLRFDMKSYMNQRFERIETDLAELKAAMRERGII
jgi:acylphosphatase